MKPHGGNIGLLNVATQRLCEEQAVILDTAETPAPINHRTI